MEVCAIRVMLALTTALTACRGEPKPAPPARRCEAEVVTDAGSYRATAEAEAGEAEAKVRKRALEGACAKSCEGRDGTAACRARCLVDIEAAKVGARVTCQGFPEGDKGATSG